MTKHDPPNMPTSAELDTFIERWQQAQAAHNRERRRRRPRQKPAAGYRLMIVPPADGRAGPPPLPRDSGQRKG